jgi:hypothetical protein
MNSTIAAARATTNTAATWAVLDGSGRVVVLFGGGEAEAEARHWQGLGYRVARLAD